MGRYLKCLNHLILIGRIETCVLMATFKVMQKGLMNGIL
ncbi:hypothetical protein SAMN04488530_11413 [Asaccharospora irregularis DSM 2635]|uniref:Uncharacterized protein n=1 Tax=Asaccharospora irregularis DSM 2635 TaxID=1121321 RepID=A0A1M5PGK1_9FIRM|nr:hypothetical protein SAMN04488530_11413 [Asaccharospora irregularis DSM 2635]